MNYFYRNKKQKICILVPQNVFFFLSIVFKCIKFVEVFDFYMRNLFETFCYNYLLNNFKNKQKNKYSIFRKLLKMVRKPRS